MRISNKYGVFNYADKAEGVSFSFYYIARIGNTLNLGEP